jgi:membrane protein implicated in regulation of membrane protease activity
MGAYLIVAGVMALAELLTGTFWLLAAVITSLGMASVLSIFPGLNLGCHALTLLILAYLSWEIMRRIKSRVKVKVTSLNNPVLRYVGYHGRVLEDFVGGKGTVNVGDTIWDAVLASNSDQELVTGDQIKVLSVSSNALMVVEKV